MEIIGFILAGLFGVLASESDRSKSTSSGSKLSGRHPCPHGGHVRCSGCGRYSCSSCARLVPFEPNGRLANGAYRSERGGCPACGAVVVYHRG